MPGASASTSSSTRPEGGVASRRIASCRGGGCIGRWASTYPRSVRAGGGTDSSRRIRLFRQSWLPLVTREPTSAYLLFGTLELYHAPRDNDQLKRENHDHAPQRTRNPCRGPAAIQDE